MRHRASWLAGVLVLAGAGPAAAQTGTGGTTPPTPVWNRAVGPGTGAGGLHQSGPIPNAHGAATGGAFGGFGAKHTGTGPTTGTGGGGSVTGSSLMDRGVTGTNQMGRGATGSSLMAGGATGSGLVGRGVTGGSLLGNGSATAGGNQIALLAEARLLVLQLEATGNLSLNRRESMLLTLLVYEALRQQAAPPGAGTGTAPTTGTVYP